MAPSATLVAEATPLPSSTPTATKLVPTITPLPSPTATQTPSTEASSPEPPPTLHAPDSPPPTQGYQVVNVYPHDREAFTQGLVYLDGIFYEGTGLRGRSSLRKVVPSSGEVLQLYALAPGYFGEGIAILDDKIYQLTWQSNIGFVYDKESFELLQTFEYPTEGWGLTHDGSQLIMSDGTATLYFLDPETMEQIGQVQVSDDRGPVIMLNELEYIDGQVYANVWQTDRIARIDPTSGQVLGWLNLAGLLSPEDHEPAVDVLNGIAYDTATGRLFVTGKLWPKVFEIRLIVQDEWPSDN